MRVSDEPYSGECREDPVPRQFKITKDILEEFGFTPRCPGCVSARLGRQARMERYSYQGSDEEVPEVSH